ncbi:MAG: ClpXP protease specificity-enhancing factor [Rhodocyclaceae bacterium]|nr:ClpXP protease specificity-enhancing factor [Rhodocyclaceae bacterium]MBL0075949.1 ClpXP protease specificity-enhancing factor [Rhodocyclaceae bacterium]MBP6109221.1 ClpXP protease specificity-enhancing factor [Rhodocyclaceae bacterium]MBP6278553.1 ClpXP protease specificity-enhancing factor [Rhodocyclaceae bacterium]
MRSTKPYLIRAIHEWCTEEGFTPYLAVAVDESTRVPREAVKNGEIVLNVGNEATNQLRIANDAVTFQARFNGRVFPVMVPIERVSAIYARENGQGMAFEIGESSGGVPLTPETSSTAIDIVRGATDPTPPPSPNKPERGSHLTRIK